MRVKKTALPSHRPGLRGRTPSHISRASLYIGRARAATHPVQTKSHKRDDGISRTIGLVRYDADRKETPMPKTTETVLAAHRATAATVIKKLERHGMDGYFCATSSEAVELVRSWMHEGDSVTWGGSETFKETGMKTALETADCYRMLDRTAASTPEEQREMWRDRTSAEWFFMSANALTLDGELVNIDGNSDRLSLLLHGPAHVVVLVGMNKLVADVDAGLKRIRTVACPLNAARLHTNTPCELTGTCAECHAAGCMCCNVVVTRHSRHEGRIRVVLIGEDLGY